MTCRHWHHDRWTPELIELWVEEPSPRFDGWSQCLLAAAGQSQDSYEKDVHPTTRAVALDREHYQADLLTAPDFGCTQWEKK